MTEPVAALSASGIRAEHGQRASASFGCSAARRRVPALISFVHDQLGSDAAYRDALGCPVRFGQTWCGFELPRVLADRRIDSADPETRRIATKYLETHYLPSTAALSERVAELARRLLPTGQCSAEAIADQLAMHPRTLQRRLAEEGVRCQDLIERERRAQAARYLAEPGLHLSQIAGLLGYYRTEHPQPFLPAVVREDAEAVPGRADGDRADMTLKRGPAAAPRLIDPTSTPTTNPCTCSSTCPWSGTARCGRSGPPRQGATVRPTSARPTGSGCTAAPVRR